MLRECPFYRVPRPRPVHNITSTSVYGDATVLNVGTAEGEILAAKGNFAVEVYTPKTSAKLGSKLESYMFKMQSPTSINTAGKSTSSINADEYLISGELETAGKGTNLVLTNKTEKGSAAAQDYVIGYYKEGATTLTSAKLPAGGKAKLVGMDLKKFFTIQRVGNAKTSEWAGTVLSFYLEEYSGLSSAPKGIDGTTDATKLTKVIIKDSRTYYEITKGTGVGDVKIGDTAVTKALAGATITVSGDEVEVVDAKKKAVAVEKADNKWTFTMPSSAVTITKKASAS